MPQENSNKIKLLKLMEILRCETDENNPLRRKEICERLAAEGISCDIRTLSKDIEVLNDFGFEVMMRKNNHENLYYIADRSFDVPELKILIDAVQAAAFIPKRKTDELIEKIAALAGSNQASVLKSNIVHFNTRKHTNESIYYNVDALEEAIQKNRKVSFRYFDLDENGQKVHRRDGQNYIAEPIALVFNEDNYYLISYSRKHDTTVNYRVDRMDSVTMTDEEVTDRTIELRGSISGYTESVFKMYGGQTVKVTLEFDPQLMGAVYDKFGECTKMLRTGDRIIAEVTVQISPTFWGWIFQFGRKMTVNAPQDIKEEYRKQAEALTEIKQD